MFVAVYRWRLKPGCEAAFRAAWSRVTAIYATEYRSGGSALFRSADGLWVGIARWPNRAARAAAFDAGPVDREAVAIMRESVADSLPDIELDCVEDQWVFPMPEPPPGP